MSHLSGARKPKIEPNLTWTHGPRLRPLPHVGKNADKLLRYSFSGELKHSGLKFHRIELVELVDPFVRLSKLIAAIGTSKNFFGQHSEHFANRMAAHSEN